MKDNRGGCRMPGATEACDGYRELSQQLAQAVEALELLVEIDHSEIACEALAAIKGEGK